MKSNPISREIFPKAPSRSSSYQNTSCNISVCVSHFFGDAGYEAGRALILGFHYVNMQ